MLYRRYSHSSKRFIPTEGIYDRKLFKLLKKKFGTYHRHHIDMSVSDGVMSNLLRKMRGKNPRQGEVVMVVPNKSGKIWLHTKASYPDEVYRLMSGGLEPDELPHKALQRVPPSIACSNLTVASTVKPCCSRRSICAVKSPFCGPYQPN